MSLPQNWETIAAFLMAHGYTPIAAAGILGNIEQESGGNPESVGSGGGGLIGFTPLPANYVTGNKSQDLQTQLNAILAYNSAQGQLLVAQLNRSRTPTEAAVFYMTRFERPAVATENQANRTSSAEDVYKALAGAQGFSPSNLFDLITQGLTGSGWTDPGTIAKDAVSSAGPLLSIESAIGKIGKYALAGGLVLVGVYFMGRRENVIPPVTSVAKTAAKVAK